jgi:flagellar biosynthesis GTPase FlhF
MKEMALKIYNNSKLFYSIGLAFALFIMFATFQDLSDFWKREAVLSFSLFSVILFAGLLVQEFSSSQKEQKEDIEEDSDCSSHKHENYPTFQSFNNEAKVVYEWEESDNEEEAEEKQNDSSEEKIKELEEKIKQLEQALANAQTTKQEQISKEKINTEKNTKPIIEDSPFG